MSSILEAQEKKRLEEATGRVSTRRRLPRGTPIRRVPKWARAAMLGVSILIVCGATWVAYNAGKSNTQDSSVSLDEVRRIILQEMQNTGEGNSTDSANPFSAMVVGPTVTPTNTTLPTVTPTTTPTPIPKTTNTPTVVPSVDTLPGLKVQGIIWGVTRVVAIINDNLIEVGDMVEDYRVIEIERQAILLENSSGRVRLNR